MARRGEGGIVRLLEIDLVNSPASEEQPLPVVRLWGCAEQCGLPRRCRKMMRARAWCPCSG